MYRTLDVRAPSDVTCVFQTTLKITVSCLEAYPSIQVALSTTVVSCSTHQRLFKQQLARWSVKGEFSTSDPSCWVVFLGPKQHNYHREDATSACTAGKNVQNLVMLSLVLSTVHTQDTGYGGEQFYMLRSTLIGLYVTQMSVRFGTSTLGLQRSFKSTAA